MMIVWTVKPQGTDATDLQDMALTYQRVLGHSLTLALQPPQLITEPDNILKALMVLESIILDLVFFFTNF